MLKFKSKVRVLSPSADYVAFHAHADEVLRMIEHDRAELHERDTRGLISAVRLIEGNAKIAVTPGSFGIRRESVDNGFRHSLLFQHRNRLYEELAA